MSTLYNPYDDDEIRGTVAGWRREASVPYIEDEPTDRESQPCWCTDFHRDVHLTLTYCPKHGRKPDPELWDHGVEMFPVELPEHVPAEAVVLRGRYDRPIGEHESGALDAAP